MVVYIFNYKDNYRLPKKLYDLYEMLNTRGIQWQENIWFQRSALQTIWCWVTPSECQAFVFAIYFHLRDRSDGQMEYTIETYFFNYIMFNIYNINVVYVINKKLNDAQDRINLFHASQTFSSTSQTFFAHIQRFSSLWKKTTVTDKAVIDQPNELQSYRAFVYWRKLILNISKASAPLVFF